MADSDFEDSRAARNFGSKISMLDSGMSNIFSMKC
jgi:hypothetical protein